VLLAENVRAVQSTPLIANSGRVFGLISSYFSAPHRPSTRDLHLLDLLARQAADYLERRRAEIALQHRTQQFETLIDQAPLGVYLVDADFKIRSVNPVARPIFGEVAGGVIGRDFAEIIHLLWQKDYADEIARIFRHTLQTGEAHLAAEGLEKRKYGRVGEHYEWRVDRIVLPDGRYGLVCYCRNISPQVQARKTQQLLVDELNHRVKNMLASVQAIVHHTLRTTKSPEDFAASFTGRIQAMSRVHALLSSGSWIVRAARVVRHACWSTPRACTGTSGCLFSTPPPSRRSPPRRASARPAGARLQALAAPAQARKSRRASACWSWRTNPSSALKSLPACKRPERRRWGRSAAQNKRWPSSKKSLSTGRCWTPTCMASRSTTSPQH
jgi:PAS domain S-box-containing protein